MKKLKLSLLQHQFDFLELKEKVKNPLFIGGKGAGKSYTLAISAFLDAMHSPNAIIGVYAPTRELVRDIDMANIIMLLTMHGFVEDKHYEVNRDQLKIKSLTKQMGNFIFRGMHDPTRIIGYQTYRAHIDELDTLTEDNARWAWRQIKERNRQWPVGLDQSHMKYEKESRQFEPENKCCAYTTPEGFRFTYKQWGKSSDPEYSFLRADTRQNTFNPKSYARDLAAEYDEKLAAAYLRGDWVNMESGSVYYAFSRPDDQGMNCGSDEVIRPGEDLHIGMDFNKNRMCAGVHVARKGGKEWHLVEEAHSLRDTPDMINHILTNWVSKGHRIFVYPDCSAGTSHSADANLTDLSQLTDAGFSVVKRYGKNKNPNILDRVNCINNAFSKNVYYVNVIKCPFAASCFEQQAFNKMGKPEKDTGFDDMMDACGYFGIIKLAIRPALRLLNFEFVNRAI